MEKQYWDISLLYVEDEKILRSVYERILTPRLRQLIIADNGEDGYNKYLDFKPDLVITDIKMPVMNGIDMIRKIHKQFPLARFIIMSAYGESHFFMRAIENGVKSFLLKPVDNEKLLSTIGEQAREIQLERIIIHEENLRRKAEQELRRNEAVLQAVSDIAEVFLQKHYNRQTIANVFRILGEASGVSRVYYFENFEENGRRFSRQVIEWVAQTIGPQIDNEVLIKVPHDDPSFRRWASTLGSRKSVFGLIKDFPDEEQEILVPQDIRSVLAVPVFIGEEWVGFIGFDDCIDERVWTQVEANTLEVAANIMGAAAQRASIEQQLRELNAGLEKRVEERTRELQVEVNERKQTEELLRDSEEKYRLIFENANDGIFLSNRGQIKFINPKAYEITGFLPKQVIGKPFTEFIHPDFREMVLENHYKRIRGEPVPESYDIQIIDANKKSKWVELKSNLIRWDETPAVLTFMTDIDIRKKYEQDLMELNQNLEERVKLELKKVDKQNQLLIQKTKLESLGELAAGMAHEINQPLGGISMSLDNIMFNKLEGKLTNEYLDGKIDLMFQDIERIRNIINHIRVFSRDQQEEMNDVVNLIQVVNNTLSLVNRLYFDHHVDLVISLDKKHSMFTGNSIKLEQVLINMLSNAKYAVDKKATTDPTYVKRISIKSRGQNNNIIIDITDNGIGIPEEYINRIFDPFFSTKSASDGTGLGLSISYGLIKEMNGSIEVDSQVNEFTRLTITLPEYIK